jgi:ubiquinone/menaquinone biosynthesis C-methylase UbiE
MDLVLALASLHHIRNMDKILGEISRVLNRGGALIIREHNMVKGGESKEFKMYLDLIHMVWDIANDERQFETGTYYSNYLSNDDWDKMMRKHGLEKVDISGVRTGLSSVYNNPQKLYYALYRKL